MDEGQHTEETLPSRWTASREFPDMWVDPADDPRESEIELHGERETLLSFLRDYRTTLEMKCADLDERQMAMRSVPPSNMSLLGMLRHMARVEQYWFRIVMAGEGVPRLYSSEDDNDWDWNGAIPDPELVADAWRSWKGEVAFAVGYVSHASDLGIRGERRDGSRISLREVLVHMIEEYARHCGHADLLRERIDGRVGQ